MRGRALERRAVVAVAESLTGGSLSAALARGADAEDWFAGGVVAYRNPTKYRVLGVPEGPVVTEATARQMALGVLRLTGADAAVAVTGVGGPGPAEGRDAGTVFLCAATSVATHDAAHVFDGEPADVVAQTMHRALELLHGCLLELRPDAG